MGNAAFTISGSTLTIHDPEKFGFDYEELYANDDFSVVHTAFSHDRRSYTIYDIVVLQKSTGRFFQSSFSRHEEEGFEWKPGEGSRCKSIWHEVFPHKITTTVYKNTPA